MTPARWQQIQELLNDALAMPTADRSGFVAVACKGDSDLQRDVDSLLEQASAASDFLSATLTAPTVALRPQPVLVGKQLGPYSVRSRLGGGGMGDVYLAEDTRLRRLVALKALHEDGRATPERRERLMREGRAVAALNHPNIAAIYDVLEAPDDPEGPPYIVMEYVEGETLSDCLRKGPLPLDRAVRIARDVAVALSAAHKRGIIHRDLKPANLRLTIHGGVKVLDFGLARMLHAAPDAPTVTLDRALQSQGGHGVAGTPGYMSPEQALGYMATPASDVFSLGVVLFQMIVGRRPFAGDDFLSAALAMIGLPVPHVADFVPGVPARVDELVARMLSKEAAERPSADEIAGVLDDELRPPAPRVETVAPPRRRYVRYFVAAAFTIAVAAGIVTSDSVRRQLGIGSGGAPIPITLAVMPVEAPADGNAMAEYLGAGIAAVIAGNFGSISHLSVLSRASTAAYGGKQDGFAALQRALGATHVLQLSWRSVDPLQLRARLYRPGVPQPEWDAMLSGNATTIEADLLDGVARTMERRPTGRRFSKDEWNRLHRMPTRSSEALLAHAEARALLDRPVVAADRAVSLLEKATALDPEFVFAWAALGDALWRKYLNEKKPEVANRAVESLRRALAIDPENAPVYYALGDVQYRTGEPTNAEASFRRALQLQPDYELAQRGLAQVLAASGRIDEAESLIQHAIGFSKNWNNFFMLGTIEYRAGRYAAAADAFRQATEAAPNNAAAFTMLGNAEYISGQLQQAVGHFEHAVRLGPTRAAHANLALAYYNSGRFEDALHSYEQALKLDPRSAVNHRNIGDVHRRLGHDQAARQEYERAIALSNEMLTVNPRDASTIGLIALCEAKLGRRSDAESHAAEAAALEPTGWEIWQRSAEVHALLNQPEAALRDLAIAVARGFEPRMARLDDELRPIANLPRFEEVLKRGAR